MEDVLVKVTHPKFSTDEAAGFLYLPQVWQCVAEVYVVCLEDGR